MAYENVNGQWPEGTDFGRSLKPTPEEATRAARRLYRFAMKRPWTGKVVVTSGRRHTWIRRGVLYVNPDERGGGWHEVVHSMSHLCAFRLHPGAAGHGYQHAFVEKEMIAHVVRSGWLNGKLRSKAKPAPDPRDVKRERMAARLKAWEAKARRADRAVTKLRRALARMDRRDA
jgi:hypothetical protein